jgi:5,10-methylenetetrahydromethanopterin reductase
MKLSCVFAPTMQTPDHIAVAEKLGYGRAWTFDTPQQSPDVFMTLTRAAERTTEIGLGPGVLVPSLRHRWHGGRAPRRARSPSSGARLIARSIRPVPGRSSPARGGCRSRRA